MRRLGLRDAKASLSAVIEAAERGEATTNDRPSFADLLMSIPEDLETERDPSPLRVPEL